MNIEGPGGMQRAKREQHFPPGPSAFRAMRGLRNLGGGDLSSVPRFFAQIAHEFDGIAHWKLLRNHFYFLDDPALIDELLVAKSRDFMKGRGIQRLKRLLGEGLLTSEAPLHLRQRRMLQPAFHKTRIAGYGARMVDATLAHMHNWRDGEAFAIDAQMTSLTLTIAADTLFGANLQADAQTVRDALGAAMHAFPASMSAYGELLDRLPMLPVTRRFNSARAQLDRVIYGIIAARRAAGGEHDDLLQMLLDARDDESSTMSDELVRDEALTIFLAGHETTANALAWTWLLLAQHPAAEAAVHAELETVLGGRGPCADDLPGLRYTHDVFAEAMRLYPPAWVIGRRAIRETSLGPWTIPCGGVVIASELVTHRNSRWWPQADAFRPERWSDGESAGRPKFAYFPFGGGPRRCIGEPFAWMEGVLVLATVAQQWRFRLTGPVPEKQPLVTLRPKSAIAVRAERRGPVRPRAAT
ncbi:MAG: cytochrome P450 [Candidatus Velthaea sp.]